MMSTLPMSLNSLKSTDIIFFVCCAAAIAVAVLIYFLIPVFNRKQYQEQRENLRKREESFKANKKAITSVDASALSSDSCDVDSSSAELTDISQTDILQGEPESNDKVNTTEADGDNL